MRRALAGAFAAVAVAGIAALPATTALARAKKTAEEKPLVGSPQPVKDLHWGDVLFYFYQGDYLQALTRLGAAQDFDRVGHHAVEGELLKGGLYLSLGQHEEAGRIFKALLNDNVPLDVRNRAWFYLAKVWYQRNYLEDSATALASIRGALPGDLEPERHLLEAQVMMYLDRYDDAIRALERWQPVGNGGDAWSAYARFNIGVALVRKDRIDDAAKLLDAVGQIEAPTEELASLRDKANLALGYAWLKAEQPARAKTVLQRVRLEGPQSNKALLGAGWADAAAKQYAAALAPWQELQGRNLLDAAVQESYLAVPFAYGELGATTQAVEYYQKAISAYDAERTRIGESIDAIRAGRLLEAALRAGGDGREGWFSQLATLPESPESRYLYHLLAGHEFQEGLKNYRALDAMARNVADWQRSLGAFGDMVQARRTAFEQKLPAADARLSTVDVLTINGRRDELQAEFESALAERDIFALATDAEREQLAMLDAVDAELVRHAGDSSYDEAREKARIARGVLIWKLDAAWKLRSWRASRSLRQLNATVYDARTRETASGRARECAPERNVALGRRVERVSPRIADLAGRIETARAEQSRRLADIAVRELEEQKKRLDEYSVQARYALATLYDRASSAEPPAQVPEPLP
jgi:hypothetical protein